MLTHLCLWASLVHTDLYSTYIYSIYMYLLAQVCAERQECMYISADEWHRETCRRRQARTAHTVDMAGRST